MQTSYPVPGPNYFSRIRYLVNIFRDPPNADALLTCVRPSPASPEEFKRVAGETKLDREKNLNFSHMRMGEESNQERVFIATLYLRDRLSSAMIDLQAWCGGKPLHKRLNLVAMEILTVEPRLRCISIKRLLDHHRRVIMLYRDLDMGLRAGACPEFVPTHFSSLARELCIIEDHIGIAQSRVNWKEHAPRKRAEKRGTTPFHQMQQYHVQAENGATMLTTADTGTWDGNMSTLAPGGVWQQGGFLETEPMEEYDEETEEVLTTTLPASAMRQQLLLQNQQWTSSHP
ncbi:MAG: hypothetical protein J3Q66DRAFT_91536 [Benniella sp.]|nr:MAG: hypothetical protein J3Q66DRAFT_91536 [Benniella sp.]